MSKLESHFTTMLDERERMKNYDEAVQSGFSFGYAMVSGDTSDTKLAAAKRRDVMNTEAIKKFTTPSFELDEETTLQDPAICDALLILTDTLLMEWKLGFESGYKAALLTKETQRENRQIVKDKVVSEENGIRIPLVKYLKEKKAARER